MREGSHGSEAAYLLCVVTNRKALHSFLFARCKLAISWLLCKLSRVLRDIRVQPNVDGLAGIGGDVFEQAVARSVIPFVGIGRSVCELTPRVFGCEGVHRHVDVRSLALRAVEFDGLGGGVAELYQDGGGHKSKVSCEICCANRASCAAK